MPAASRANSSKGFWRLLPVSLLVLILVIYSSKDLGGQGETWIPHHGTVAQAALEALEESVKQHFPKSRVFVMSHWAQGCDSRVVANLSCDPHALRLGPGTEDAALALNTEYLVFLDQHVLVQGPIRNAPAEAAAWGFESRRSLVLAEEVATLGQERAP
eukprot:Skav236658  [mRNA]  locus=scaffold3354:34053:36453:+ [translate_table: standard]